VGDRRKDTTKRRGKAKPALEVRPFEVLPFDPTAVAAAKRLFVEQLENIFTFAGSRTAYDELIEAGCDRAFLECYLITPIQPAASGERAESRKEELNDTKALLKTLIKAWKLATKFGQLSGESMAYLDHALSTAIEQIRPWAERRRPVPLFTPRQDQQFRLLNHIALRTRHQHCAKAATLLGAMYHAGGVPEEEYPTESALQYLTERFEQNRKAWRGTKPKTHRTNQ
jgi:hypothetical protein